jgi:hypothetical protein
MSECYLERFIIMTGSDKAEERSVSNDGDVRKLSKLGTAWIFEISSASSKLTLLQHETTECVHRLEALLG